MLVMTRGIAGKVRLLVTAVSVVSLGAIPDALAQSRLPASDEPGRIERRFPSPADALKDPYAPDYLPPVTPGQQRVIFCLARYRYMTVRQFVDAGAGKYESTVRDHLLYRLARRARGNLLQYREYFAVSAHRRRPFVYALTGHGAAVAAELLDEEPGSIRYPVGGIAHVHDYEHREAYIDACIALDRWAEADEAREVLFLSHYFDKTGANRKGGR